MCHIGRRSEVYPSAGLRRAGMAVSENAELEPEPILESRSADEEVSGYSKDVSQGREMTEYEHLCGRR